MSHELTSTNGMSEIRTFVECVCELDDLIEVRRLPSGRSTWCRARELPDLADNLRKDNAARQNIFIGPNPRSCYGDGATAANCHGGRCGRCDKCVDHCRSLFSDFDHGTNAEEALDRIEKAGLPKPTIVIASGHGVHVYWVLTEPLSDLAEWTRFQKGLAELLGADRTVRNPSRVMRLPGFVNHKPPPAFCIIVHADPSRRYSLDALTRVIPDVAEPDGTATPDGRPSPRPVSLDVLSRGVDYAGTWENVPEGERNSAAEYHAAQLILQRHLVIWVANTSVLDAKNPVFKGSEAHAAL